MSVTLQRASFLLVALGVALVFMRYVDRVNQKRLFMAGAVLQIFALLLFAIVPLSLPVALGYVLLLGIGGGFAQQPSSRSGAARCSPRSCARRRRA